MGRIHGLRLIIVVCLFIFLIVLFAVVEVALSNSNNRPGNQAQEPIILVLEPDITPDWADNCGTDWMKFPTILGSDAYLTLNVNPPTPSTNHGEWEPELPEEGFYRVEAYIPHHDPITWCSGKVKEAETADAHYLIQHALGTSLVIRSQEVITDTWLDLGTYLFTPSATISVTLSDATNETNYQKTIVFSAMRFTYLSLANQIYIPFIQQQIESNPTPVFETQVQTGHGFDACNLPSISNMKIWWEKSPYYFYGLYLGGAMSPAGCKKADAMWVEQVRAQGWSFIPTWVGPQAPCSGFKVEFSPDPSSAYLEGRAEADLALQAAFNMGVVSQPQNKTILYYDLEGYGEADLACRTAVSAFIDGWVARLHELGHHAGVYGGVCNTYASDWAGLPNVPDAVWLADKYANSFTASVPLTGLRCVNDNLWSNHQRIRQYAFDYIDSWGGVSLAIDGNFADAEVAIPGGVPIITPPPLEILSLSPNIQGFQWLDSQFGWILLDNIFYMTNDRGITWQQAPFTGVLNAYFLDDQTGYLMGASNLGDALWFIYKTQDQGATWEKINLPTPDLQPGWQPISMIFTNHDQGEIRFKKRTSSAFHITATYTTSYGGINWQSEPIQDESRTDESQALFHQLVSPSAFPDLHHLPGTPANGFFLDSQNGWIATGDSDCSGEKGSSNFTCWRQETLWMTSNGGYSWQLLHLPLPGKK